MPSHKTKIINTLLPDIKADLFISCGSACRPAHWLRKYDLRKASYPFDWMCEYSLDFYAETIKQGCFDWFDSYHEGHIHSDVTRKIVDDKTGLVSLHAFPKNEAVETFLPKFHQIFDEKYLKFKQALEDNQNICFVANRGESTEKFVSFAQKLNQLYPEKMFTIVNLKHDLEKRKTEKTIACKNVTLYTIYADDRNENGADFATNPQTFWIGNTKLWEEICSHLSLTVVGKKVKPNKFFSVSNKKNRKIIRLLGIKITI